LEVQKIPRDVLAFAALIFAFVLSAWLGIAGPLVKDFTGKGFYEFLKDWQTLIGAMVALGAAFIAVRPVWRQLGEMQRQNAHTQLELLRRRSIELEKERTQIYELTSSIDLVARALVNFHEKSLALGKLDAPAAQRLVDTESYLNSSIEKFIREAGPAWGGVDMQAARATCRDDAQRFSVELTKFTDSLANGVAITPKDLDDLANRLVPFKNSVWNAGNRLHAGIVFEAQKTGATISNLERVVFHTL
jgi:hypothetical protein